MGGPRDGEVPSYPDIPKTVRAIKVGADDFLTKPVTSDDRLRAIERAFAHHEVSRRVV